MMASRAVSRDREISAKFRDDRARSLTREISFSFQAYSVENFRALVLFTK